MNGESIGYAAGVVWQHLHESEGPVSLAALKRLKSLKPDEALAAVGWLAREGKLTFVEQGRRVLVSLAESYAL